MKTLNQYIQEKLIINKDYSDGKMYHPKSFDELRKIIDDRYDKLGPGTEHNPIDFNDIDVSNLDPFYPFYSSVTGIGIFQETKFKYIDISSWDVSNVKSTRYMFFMCKELESVGDLSNWDVSKVTNMCSMFYNCKALKTVGDISSWNVSNVEHMGYMFYGCTYFNQDISNWDVSKVRHHEFMFFYNRLIKDEYKPKFK